jgi:hypothetical protein
MREVQGLHDFAPLNSGKMHGKEFAESTQAPIAEDHRPVSKISAAQAQAACSHSQTIGGVAIEQCPP